MHPNEPSFQARASTGRTAALVSAAHSPPSAGPPGKIIRLPAVEEITGLKRSSIYAGMRAGTFPFSVKLSFKAVGWYEAAVLAWCESREKTGVGRPFEGRMES